MSEAKITRLDNRPPEPIVETPEDIAERLARDHKSLLDKIADREVGVLRTPDPIANDSDAILVTDWVGQLQALVVEIENAHKPEKAPYLAASRAIDGFFRAPKERLTTSLGMLRLRLHGFQREKQRRAEELQRAAKARASKIAKVAPIEAQRAAQAAREAAERGDREAARKAQEEERSHQEALKEAEATIAAPPVKVNVKGDYGSTAFVVEKWTFEIVDPSKIPLGYLKPDEDAIQQAIDETKGQIEIPGLRIFRNDRLQVKRG